MVTQGPVTRTPSTEKPGVTHEETTRALALNVDTGRERESSMQVSLGSPGHWGLGVIACPAVVQEPRHCLYMGSALPGEQRLSGYEGERRRPWPLEHHHQMTRDWNILPGPSSGSGNTRHVSQDDNREGRFGAQGRTAFLLPKSNCKDTLA